MSTAPPVRVPAATGPSPLPLPEASARDTLRIAALLVAPTLARGVVRRRAPVVALIARTDADRRAGALLGELRGLHGEGPLRVNLFGRRILLVSAAEDRPPLRAFTEAVLDTGAPAHHDAAAFLAAVREEARALAAALGDTGALTWDRFTPAFGNAVRRVVLGDGARDDHRTSALLSRLRRDANWGYARPVRTRTRAEFPARVRGHLDRAEAGGLAASAAGAAAARPGEELHPESQVAHWLFAFDAAAIVAFRALALVAAHQAAASVIDGELAARPPSDPGGVLAQEHLRATVLESVRLWPTTLVLLRETAAEGRWHGSTGPAGTPVAVFCPFFHRDGGRLAHADVFAPRTGSTGPRGATGPSRPSVTARPAAPAGTWCCSSRRPSWTRCWRSGCSGPSPRGRPARSSPTGRCPARWTTSACAWPARRTG